MAIYATYTQLGCVSGREQRAAGSDAWVKLDGRKSRQNLLADAIEVFGKRNPYRVVVCSGELRAGSTLVPVIYTHQNSIHRVGEGADGPAIQALIN